MKKHMNEIRLNSRECSGNRVPAKSCETVLCLVNPRRRKKHESTEIRLSLSSAIRLFVVMERIRWREWLQAYFRSRSENGEFAQFYAELKSDNMKFFECIPMSQPTSHYI